MKIELKKFDYVIISVVILLALLVVGIFLTKSKIAKTPVLSEDTVVFQVFFRGVTITSPQSPLKSMDESFITIRNVPHKKVTILEAIQRPRVANMIDNKGMPIAIEDASTPFLYDCLVTLYDDAKITDDGVVLGGNKLKMGLPIILEGKNYRFAGTVTNINVLSADEAKSLKEAVAKEKERLANPQPISPLELMGAGFDIKQ